MFTTHKIATVSVINDLVSDNRVNKTCLVLKECGYDVILIGRKLPNSSRIPDWPFKSIRMRLFFLSGPAFYLFFNLRLFLQLIFRKTHLLYANDLDTLLPNFIVSRIRNIPMIYDSHELFCEVPELKKSKIKKAVWLWLEGALVPNLKTCITVNDSIAKIFEEKYKVKFNTVRNISNAPRHIKLKPREELGLPIDKKIILMQGAGINMDRGAEELVEAMHLVEGAVLVIIGSGDVWGVLKKKVLKEQMGERVRLIDKLPKEDLAHYTGNADIGLSIDKNTNLNYYYSLPNKIFDYIQAGLPILASRLPEVEKIISAYQVGEFVESHEPKALAQKIISMLNSRELLKYRENAMQASAILTWEKEKGTLETIIKSVIRQ